MNEIKAKVYYEISTGIVLIITHEMQGCVEETTKEQDMETYPQLKDKNIDEIDCVELEYGAFVSTFTNIKSYKVNLETKSLDCVYFTQEELEEQRKQYEQQNQEAQLLNDKVSNISEYLNQYMSTIADVEDYILQIEQNKILGVV